MGTGIWANFHWKNGIWVTGTGNHKQINNANGTGIWKNFTYVQDWTQVLFNEYFMFDCVIWHFHITTYLTDFGVFWWTFINENTLWWLLWGGCISFAFNPGHIWKIWEMRFISPSSPASGPSLYSTNNTECIHAWVDHRAGKNIN